MLFVLVIAAEPKKATVAAEPVVLDTAEATAKVVHQLLQAKAPVAVDFEGVDLCRNGELALVLLSDGTTTWLVDITTMGQAAFEDDGGRLRLLLESKDVLKVGYDGRGDADALHHLHKTGLAQYYDVQIAACMRQDAEQGRRDPFVHGLGKAMASFLRAAGGARNGGRVPARRGQTTHRASAGRARYSKGARGEARGTTAAGGAAANA